MVEPVASASASDAVMFSRRTSVSSSVRCTPISFIGRRPEISTDSMAMVRAVESRCAAAGRAQVRQRSIVAVRSTRSVAFGYGPVAADAAHFGRNLADQRGFGVHAVCTLMKSICCRLAGEPSAVTASLMRRRLVVPIRSTVEKLSA